MKRKTAVAVMVGLVAFAFSMGLVAGTTRASAASAAPPIKISGNHIVNADTGAIVQLHGVTEGSWANGCHQANPVLWNGLTSAVAAGPADWTGINEIRLQLNEDCWLGINGYPTAPMTGVDYQQGVIDTVTDANAAGLWVDLSLAASGPGTLQSVTQNTMIDLDHGAAFWNSVANTFKGNDAVMFEMYNEPRPNGASGSGVPGDTPFAANCVLNGGAAGTCASFATVGMQTIANDIRSDGADNILIEGGPRSQQDPDLFLSNYRISDPQRNFMPSWHAYPGNGCSILTCWNTVIKGITDAGYPVDQSESGGKTNAAPPDPSYPISVINWIDTGDPNTSTGGSPIDNGAISAGGEFVWDVHFGGSDNMLSAFPSAPLAPYGTGMQAAFSAMPTIFTDGPSWTVEGSASAVGNSSTTQTVTMPVATTGDKLIAFLESNGTPTFVSLSDSHGNGFTLLTSHSRASCTGCTLTDSLYYLDAPEDDIGTQPVITATFSGALDISLVVQDVAGLASGNDLDGTAGNLNGAGGSSTGNPSYTSLAANAYLLTFGGSGQGTAFGAGPQPTGRGHMWTTPSGWTADPNQVNGNLAGDQVVAYEASTGGAETGSWGLSGAPFWEDTTVALR